MKNFQNSSKFEINRVRMEIIREFHILLSRSAKYPPLVKKASLIKQLILNRLNIIQRFN
jgi:hypothetical protein